VVISDISRCL